LITDNILLAYECVHAINNMKKMKIRSLCSEIRYA